MIYAFDTYYYADYANTVCIAFEDWFSEKESEIFSEKTSIISEYESGAFYKRELPCIVSLLSKIPLIEGHGSYRIPALLKKLDQLTRG